MLYILAGWEEQGVIVRKSIDEIVTFIEKKHIINYPISDIMETDITVLLDDMIGNAYWLYISPEPLIILDGNYSKDMFMAILMEKHNIVRKDLSTVKEFVDLIERERSRITSKREGCGI